MNEQEQIINISIGKEIIIKVVENGITNTLFKNHPRINHIKNGVLDLNKLLHFFIINNHIVKENIVIELNISRDGYIFLLNNNIELLNISKYILSEFNLNNLYDNNLGLLKLQNFKPLKIKTGNFNQKIKKFYFKISNKKNDINKFLDINYFFNYLSNNKFDCLEIENLEIFDFSFIQKTNKLILNYVNKVIGKLNLEKMELLSFFSVKDFGDSNFNQLKYVKELSLYEFNLKYINLLLNDNIKIDKLSIFYKNKTKTGNIKLNIKDKEFVNIEGLLFERKSVFCNIKELILSLDNNINITNKNLLIENTENVKLKLKNHNSLYGIKLKNINYLNVLFFLKNLDNIKELIQTKEILLNNDFNSVENKEITFYLSLSNFQNVNHYKVFLPLKNLLNLKNIEEFSEELIKWYKNNYLILNKTIFYIPKFLEDNKELLKIKNKLFLFLNQI